MTPQLPQLIEQIVLSKRYVKQVLEHIKTKKYHKVYIALKNVETHITSAKKLVGLPKIRI